MKNIRARREGKVNIQVPIFKDTFTNLTEATIEEPYPGQIYMDAMTFGMGCSCIQATFETQNMNHALHLHDQLLAWTPIFAALSASAPVYKGKLSDVDLRWNTIVGSVDCRTPAERDPSSADYIHKSRYSTINSYISEHEYVNDDLDN